MRLTLKWQYKVTRNIWTRSRTKALLVDRLIDGLREQEAVIQVDLLLLLLRAAGVEEDESPVVDGSNCYEILQKKDLAHGVSQHLGRLYDPYQKALGRCEEIVASIARSIDGLTPTVQNQQFVRPEAHSAKQTGHSRYLEGLIRNNAMQKKSILSQTVQKIKFALNKDEVDRLISELDASTVKMSRFRGLGERLQDEGTPSSSRTVATFATFLRKVQTYSNHLYSAISAGCSINCHPSHTTNIYLEDRSAPLLRKKALKSPVTFNIELVSDTETPKEPTQRHANIQVVVEDEHESGENIGPASQRPRIQFDVQAPSEPEKT
ncbi:hypothetical protein ACLMJK_004622 [Lecanora helva]